MRCKIAQSLSMINIQRLPCTVIKFLFIHVVKEAMEVVLYILQDF